MCTDSVAAVLTDGLLGSVFIQIQSGSAGAPTVEDGDRIRGVDAVEIADFIEEGRESFSTVAEGFTQTLGDLGATIESSSELLTAVGEELEAITTASAQSMEGALTVLEDTRVFVAGLSKDEGTVGRLLEDDALYEGLVGTVEKTHAKMRAARKRVEQLERVFARLSRPEGDRTRLLTDAGNLDQLARDEYRELLRDDRYTPLRVWIEGDALFETDGEGRIALADSAVARLDEAMAGPVGWSTERTLSAEEGG